MRVLFYPQVCLAAEGTGTGSPAPASPEAPAATPAVPAGEPSAVADAKTPPAEAAAPAAPPTSLLGAAEAKAPETPKTDAAKVEPAPAAMEPGKEPAKDAKADPEKKPEPEKKEEPAKAEGEPKPDAEAKTPEPAKPISYEPFKLPEGLKLDDERLKPFTEILGERQVPQEQAQKLLDLHLAEMGRMYNDAAEYQRKQFNTLNDGWKNDLRADTDIGGNRLNTSLAMAKAVVEEFGGTKEQQTEFFKLISENEGNGMGNNKALVRLLHNIGVAMNVFEDKIVPANPATPNLDNRKGFSRHYNKGNGAAA